MARTTRRELLDTLTPAVPFLREHGKGEWADALESVLAPGGWTHLREAEGAFTENVPLTIRRSLRDALEEAAAKSSKIQSLSAIVTEGCQRVLDGAWTPPRPAGRTAMASGDSRSVLNVTVDHDVLEQLRERLGSLGSQLGYRVTVSGIAIAYLREKLGVTDEVLASHVKRLAP
ncbi:hypothetical protein [Streptomyces olivaceoviridis]|uniref:hypothetical protein n=1 Tax=Streptomyces olivaceoviridis TaxID=1921 RepID=UPI003683A186